MPRRSAAAQASAQRRLSMPTFALTSSKWPLPRLWKRYLRPPFLAYSKLSGIMRVFFRCQRSTSLGIVAGDKQIELAVAIVVEPDRGIRVDPGRQTGLVGDARESLAVIVVEQLRPAPLDQEEIFIAVVVVVAPHGAHRDAGARLVHVGDAQLLRDVGEGAVVVVAVEMVQAADAAVGDIDVGPAVAVEVDDGDRCAHRGDFRHDAVEFVIEDGSLVHEVDARLVGDFLEAETIASQRGLAIRPGRRLALPGHGRSGGSSRAWPACR